jgi:hypothetical protein
MKYWGPPALRCRVLYGVNSTGKAENGRFSLRHDLMDGSRPEQAAGRRTLPRRR